VHYAKRGESVVRTFVFESDTPIAQLGARDGSWTAFAEDTSVRMAKVLGPRQPGDRVLGVFIRRAQLAQHWPTVKERSWLARQLARWLDYLEA
jgi:hypothetical protein